jgi:hypothetical protein
MSAATSEATPDTDSKPSGTIHFLGHDSFPWGLLAPGGFLALMRAPPFPRLDVLILTRADEGKCCIKDSRFGSSSLSGDRNKSSLQTAGCAAGCVD